MSSSVGDAKSGRNGPAGSEQPRESGQSQDLALVGGDGDGDDDDDDNGGGNDDNDANNDSDNGNDNGNDNDNDERDNEDDGDGSAPGGAGEESDDADLVYFNAFSSVKLLVPPLNFAIVAPGVYRSGYPNKKNFPFLKKLGLKSILYLCPEPYADTNMQLIKEQNIKLLQYKIQGNKEPFTHISQQTLKDALIQLLDESNRPLLVHCNKGKHRTGCLIGCLRKVQKWSIVSIFDEYRRFAGTKVRVLDQQFIELFDTNDISAV